jgi:hypothetical protein
MTNGYRVLQQVRRRYGSPRRFKVSKGRVATEVREKKPGNDRVDAHDSYRCCSTAACSWRDQASSNSSRAKKLAGDDDDDDEWRRMVRARQMACTTRRCHGAWASKREIMTSPWGKPASVSSSGISGGGWGMDTGEEDATVARRGHTKQLLAAAVGRGSKVVVRTGRSRTFAMFGSADRNERSRGGSRRIPKDSIGDAVLVTAAGTTSSSSVVVVSVGSTKGGEAPRHLVGDSTVEIPLKSGQWSEDSGGVPAAAEESKFILRRGWIKDVE